MSLTESIVGDAVLTWFGELAYAVGHGPQMAPGESTEELESFGYYISIYARQQPKLDEEFEEISEGAKLTKKEKLKTKWRGPPIVGMVGLKVNKPPTAGRMETRESGDKSRVDELA